MLRLRWFSYYTNWLAFFILEISSRTIDPLSRSFRSFSMARALLIFCAMIETNVQKRKKKNRCIDLSRPEHPSKRSSDLQKYFIIRRDVLGKKLSRGDVWEYHPAEKKIRNF